MQIVTKLYIWLAIALDFDLSALLNFLVNNYRTKTGTSQLICDVGIFIVESRARLSGTEE
ncbi:hypothetical protein [Iningainema tapete]|uniref:Uncharacterized protein n=1 Tax=Iningainema tapete BLCC-T55 TaxID=2748662 RepID=A0A8J6XLW0_9CYAN|nr:hypothetical protein [Iningainema tapete]MBD2775241.1 hypothetical protein [Iningainema tapete BLCC-T55]